jgi:hypothetical protein
MNTTNDPEMTPKRIKFIETYNKWDDSNILKEILFAQQLQLDKLNKLENIRSNTSILAWWLVAIPIILFILALVFGVIGGSTFL